MSALSLESCHYYSNLPDNLRIPGRPVPAPHPDVQAHLADQEQFGKSSEISLRVEKGVPSQATAGFREPGNVTPERC